MRAAAARARSEGFGAVAVALLFSFLDPEHELRVEEILLEELDGVTVCSRTVSPASGGSTSGRPPR